MTRQLNCEVLVAVISTFIEMVDGLCLDCYVMMMFILVCFVRCV
jgi:hypothetical protein